MLPDTSNASTTVPSRCGWEMVACGRASGDEQQRQARRGTAPARRAAAVRGARCGRDQAQRGQLGAPARPAAREQPPIRQHQQRDGSEAQQHPRPRRSVIAAAACAAPRSGPGPARGPRRCVTVYSSAPAVRGRPRQRGLPLVGRRAQPLLEPGVVGVDEDLLAGLGVLDVDHPGRRAARTRAGRRTWMATTSCRRASSASGRSQPGSRDEVGDDHDQRPAPGDRRARRAARPRGRWSAAAPAARRTPQRRRASASAARGSAAPGCGPEPGGIVCSTPVSKSSAPIRLPPRASSCATVAATSVSTTCLLPLDRAEVHRRRAVEQQPRGDLAVLEVLPHVGRVHPRGDVPVDVAQVVAGLVLAQVRDVDPRPAEQGPVVALQPAVEPADDPPLQAAQDALGRQGWLVATMSRCTVGAGAPRCVAHAALAHGTSARTVEDRPEQVVGRDAVGQRLVGEHDAVAQHVACQVARVVRQGVVASAQEGERLGAEHQVDRGPGAGAEGHVARQVGQADGG